MCGLVFYCVVRYIIIMITTTKNLIVGFIILIILGLGLFYFMKNERKPVVVEGWKNQANTAQKVEFMYPEDLGKKYIFAVNWPPMVLVSTNEFSCTETGSETSEIGEIVLIKVKGNSYCVTKVREGAAGSTYTQYAYEREIDEKNVTLSFTLRTPQCGNYNEPEKITCETEQNSFKLDNLVNQIFGTLKFIN